MPKPKSKNALSWANAVKMWNMHKKIYDPTHVYAMPKKGTAEYDDAKHVQVHGALPAHLHKKAPFPAAALEQLRKHEKESEARREIAKREKVIEQIKAATPAKAEAAPKIVVPPLPARLEKKEEARLEVEPVKKKVVSAKAKIIAEIVEETKKGEEEKIDFLKFDAIKELGKDGEEPKKGISADKLKAQSEKVNAMYRHVLDLLKQTKTIDDFSKRIKASSHIQEELYKVDELRDLIIEAGGGKALFEKKKVEPLEKKKDEPLEKKKVEPPPTLEVESESESESEDEEEKERVEIRKKNRAVIQILSDSLGGSSAKVNRARKELEKYYPGIQETDTKKAREKAEEKGEPWMKALAKNKVIYNVIDAKMGDFFPTPFHCLEKNEECREIIEFGTKFFEPTAGIGSMVESILTINPDAKIVANELNSSLSHLLKEFFPKIEVTEKNLFRYPNKNDFDTYICNPPFSKGAHFNFLFKLLNMMNESTQQKKHKNIIFICPNIPMENVKSIGDGFDEHLFFSTNEIINALPEYLKMENRLTNTVRVGGTSITAETFKKQLKLFFKNPDKLTKQQEEDFEDGDILNDGLEEDFGFWQGQLIGKCTGFGGTTVSANIYKFTSTKRYGRIDDPPQNLTYSDEA